MSKHFKLLIFFMFALFLSLIVAGCSDKEKVVITNIKQLNDKEFGIPTGTVADKLVLSVFPNAKFQYYNSVLDAAIAVKQGKVDAAAYDEPILRNIAAKNPGLIVLSEMITKDDYGFAVNQSHPGERCAYRPRCADAITRWCAGRTWPYRFYFPLLLVLLVSCGGDVVCVSSFFFAWLTEWKAV